jgi:hypothetical protein
MAENGGTDPSGDPAVKSAPRQLVPLYLSHQVVEERSSSITTLLRQVAEEATVLESQKYRQYAADCIRLSQTMSAADKLRLLEIAAAWEKRAQEAERLETSNS